MTEESRGAADARPLLRVLYVTQSRFHAASLHAALEPHFQVELQTTDTPAAAALIPSYADILLADAGVPSQENKSVSELPKGCPDTWNQAVLEISRQTDTSRPLIFMLPAGHAETGLNLMRQGARDFILSSDPPLRLVAVIGREMAENRYRQDGTETERMKRLLERAIQDPVWEWDLESGDRRWSDGLRLAFKYEPSQVQASNQWWYQRVHAEDKARVIDSLRSALDTRKTIWSEEYRFRDAEEQWHRVLDRAHIIYNQDHEPLRIIGSTMSLSKRESAMGSNLSEFCQNRLLVGLTHDLRTPLHNITVATAVLQDEMLGPLTASQVEYVELVRKNASQLLTIVNDILDLAKKESTEIPLRPEKVRIETILEDVCHLMQPLMTQKSQRCEVKIDKQVPESFIADPLRVKQMLTNLMSNAHKFSAPGTAIRVGCSLRDNGELIFSVIDQGPGIPKEELAQVMRPFEQRLADTCGSIKGSGLGLPLVQTLAQLHRGRLEIKSQPGQGSEFSVALPFRQ